MRSDDPDAAPLGRRERVRALLPMAALVAVGGALGTTVRALLEGALPPAPGSVPWTTFAINVVGSFLLGALLERLALAGGDDGARRLLRLGCGTGVIGGFTTYSTFVLEVERLLAGGHGAVGLGYAVGSVLLGIVTAVLGIVAARRFGVPRAAGARS